MNKTVFKVETTLEDRIEINVEEEIASLEAIIEKIRTFKLDEIPQSLRVSLLIVLDDARYAEGLFARWLEGAEK